jgi:hypothetical protein
MVTTKASMRDAFVTALERTGSRIETGRAASNPAQHL